MFRFFILGFLLLAFWSCEQKNGGTVLIEKPQNEKKPADSILVSLDTISVNCNSIIPAGAVDPSNFYRLPALCQILKIRKFNPELASDSMLHAEKTEVSMVAAGMAIADLAWMAEQGGNVLSCIEMIRSVCQSQHIKVIDSGNLLDRIRQNSKDKDSILFLSSLWLQDAVAEVSKNKADYFLLIYGAEMEYLYLNSLVCNNDKSGNFIARMTRDNLLEYLICFARRNQLSSAYPAVSGSLVDLYLLEQETDSLVLDGKTFRNKINSAHLEEFCSYVKNLRKKLESGMITGSEKP
jgi:hypothetical protein